MPVESVVWGNLVNTTAQANGGLKKTGGTDSVSDAGGLSTQEVGDGGYFEFTFDSLAYEMYVGFGTDPATTYSNITHGFNFTASSIIEIREGGNYVDDVSVTVGDTLKLAIVGTTVKYYKNGVFLRNGIASVTTPTHCDVTFTSANAEIKNCNVLPVDGGGGGGGEEGLYPGTITDYTVRTPGATPSIAKGAKITDALFGHQILRVTDGTSPVTANYSMRTPSAPNQMAWTAEGDRFYVIDDSLNVYVYEFDPTNFTATFNRRVAWGIEPAFPRVTGKRHIMYGVRFIATHVIEKYDFTANSGAGGFSTVLDLKTIDPSLTDSVYTSSLYVSGGSTERGVVNYGGTGQGLHMKVTVFDVNNPTTQRRTIHTVNSTIDLHDGNGPQAVKDETNTNVTMNFLTHSISISNDGNTVRIDPEGTAAYHWLYDWTLNRFKKVDQYPWGHYTLGWGYEVNEDQGAGPKMQWQFRSLALASANSPTPRITSDNPDHIVHTEDHTSWHNANSAANALLPFFSECQIAGGDPWSYWSNEIIAVAATGPEKVWRFCHHRCDAYFDDDVSKTELGTFYYEPMLQVDPTGRYVAFASNWDKTLGTHPSPPASNIAKRMDVFIVSLGDPGTAPVTISPTTGGLSLSGQTPTRQIGGSTTTTVSPATGSLSLSGQVLARQTGSLTMTTVTITGSIYSAATGNKVTTGTLYLKPKAFLRNGNDLVAPKTISYSIPGSGNISLAVAPSTDNVAYIVEFDPNPADTTTPRKLKSGYFYDEWIVPSSGPVDIATL